MRERRREMWRVRGQEAGQTLEEWKEHILKAVQRRDAQEAIEDSEVRTIRGTGAEGITTVITGRNRAIGTDTETGTQIP